MKTIMQFIASAAALVVSSTAADPVADARPSWTVHNLTRSPERQEGEAVVVIDSASPRHAFVALAAAIDESSALLWASYLTIEASPTPALRQHVLRHDLKSGETKIFGPLESTARPFPTTLPLNRVFGDYAGISAANGKVIATFSSNCAEIAGVKNPSAAGDVGVAVFDAAGK